MTKLLGRLGATAGRWIGWAAGGQAETMTALVLSIAGACGGPCAGRRIARNHFE